jgi:CheY-like chemotaxis protein
MGEIRVRDLRFSPEETGAFLEQLIKPVNASTLFDAIMQSLGEEIPETSRLAKRQKETDAMQEIRGARILLVDDNEINQQVAQEILEGVGFIVTVCGNGQEAVDAVKGKRYDAVLMDVQMPVMDGYTATKRIRKWESVSANADSDVWGTEDRGQRAGDRGQRAEDRGQRAEVRGQRAEDRGQRTEDRGQRAEDRGQRTEDRGQRAEDRGQETEVRGQKTEGRRQRTEGRRQRSEDRRQKSEDRRQRAEDRR